MKKIKNKIEELNTDVFRFSELLQTLQPHFILKRIISFVLFITISTVGFSAGEIGKKILRAKAEGNQFIKVNNLLIANTNYSSQAIEQELVNPEYFDFDANVALDLINNRKQYITINLPVAVGSSQLIKLDLMAVSTIDYDFTINTSSGLQYSGGDLNLIHYRGVVRNYETESVVFLSISDDHVLMDISIDNEGEFELYKHEVENIHVFYNQSDVPHLFDLTLNCGTSQDSPSPQGGSRASRKKESDKCLYLFLEVEHEVYQQASSLDKLEKNILETFNKTAGMYENIGVTIRLKELKIWNTPDPYTYNVTTTDWNIDWWNKKSDYLASAVIPTDVNLSQLLTTYKAGGASTGVAGSFNCVDGVSTPYPSIVTVSGGCNKGNCMKRQIKTMAHEFGHTLGSGHIFDCHWNDDCTKLGYPGLSVPSNTVCDGVSVGPCGPPSPSDDDEYYSTIMGYTGELPLFNPFGDQPGQKILDFVNSQTCLTSCIVDCDDLTYSITVSASEDVFAGEEDYRHSEIGTFVYNEIYIGGEANYYSATRVFLKPNFKARYGSDFHAAIKPCINYGNITYGSRKKSPSKIGDLKIDQLDKNPLVRAYPNPTKGNLTIELTQNSSYNLIVYDVVGKLIFEKNNVNEKRLELDMSNEKQGVYILQVVNEEGYTQTVKLILE